MHISSRSTDAYMAPSNSRNFAMKRLFCQHEVAKRREYVSTWVNLDWQTKLAVGCQEEEACWAWNGVHASYCCTIIILGAALWASQHSLAGLFPPQSTSFFSPFFSLTRRIMALHVSQLSTRIRALTGGGGSAFSLCSQWGVRWL